MEFLKQSPNRVSPVSSNSYMCYDPNIDQRKKSFFMLNLFRAGINKFRKAFAKTRAILGDKIQVVFGKPLDADTLDELEQILFEADFGSALVTQFIDHIQTFAKKHPGAKGSALMDALKDYALTLLETPPKTESKPKPQEKPELILMVGVNGSGKTTTSAKLAHILQKEKKQVLLAAGDTFRAAAIEQLGVWADRLKIDCVKGKPGGDPAAVVFDAITSAKAKGADIVIADTAGRLQSKSDLMAELEKITRVAKKGMPNAPHEIFLVIDATTGQNGVDQAKIFHSVAPLTGLILTKLDGSAKGGVLLSIYHQMGIPIRYIGLGEGVEDLTPFDPKGYVEALFS